MPKLAVGTQLADHHIPPIPQRNLNNAFAYDLVPSASVVVAALKAARRVNDFPTAVRIFEGKKPLPLDESCGIYMAEQIQACAAD